MSSIHASKSFRAVTGRAFGVLLVLAAAARTAAAQPAPAQDAALAETLFEDAKKRMDSGDFVSACPKLAESYRLDPGSGTLTALALCNEQIGKTATAWAEFIEVVDAAQQAGRSDREKFARQHASSLEPTLSRLTLHVAPETARLAEVQVRRDKVIVGQAAWGTASPVDPGDHVIEASAPGKQTWSTRIMLGKTADRQIVNIPPLEDKVYASNDAAPGMGAAEDAKDTPASTPAPSNGSGQRVAGIVVGVAGLAALGAGAFFGLEAIAKSRDAKQQCSPSSCTDPAAVRENDTAKTDALLSDLSLGVGIVAVGVGTYLLVAAPHAAPAPAAETSRRGRRSPSALRLVPRFGLRGGELDLQTAW